MPDKIISNPCARQAPWPFGQGQGPTREPDGRTAMHDQSDGLDAAERVAVDVRVAGDQARGRVCDGQTSPSGSITLTAGGA